MKDAQNQDSQQKTLYEGSLVEVRLKAVGEQGALRGSDYEGIESKYGLDAENLEVGKNAVQESEKQRKVMMNFIR